MTITRLLLLGAFAGVIAWGAYRHFDPYRAKLPLGSTDLSSLQDTLDRLPPQDRSLALDYVKRTGGASDSDSILVADQLAAMPTLREAIARQQAWVDKSARFNTSLNAAFAAYNAQFDALRKALQIELVRSDASAPHPHTFRFKNTTPHTIEAFEAHVMVRKARMSLTESGGFLAARVGFAYPFPQGRLAFLPAGYRHPVLIPFASVEMNSPPLAAGNLPLAKAADGELIVETYPTYIRFAGGEELKVPEHILKQAPKAGDVLRQISAE